jgi:hypothetical protein
VGSVWPTSLPGRSPVAGTGARQALRSAAADRIVAGAAAKRGISHAIYKRPGNLRACQLLLGLTKLDSSVRYLGIEVDDLLLLSEQTDL